MYWIPMRSSSWKWNGNEFVGKRGSWEKAEREDRGENGLCCVPGPDYSGVYICLTAARMLIAHLPDFIRNWDAFSPIPDLLFAGQSLFSLALSLRNFFYRIQGYAGHPFFSRAGQGTAGGQENKFSGQNRTGRGRARAKICGAGQGKTVRK